jgi:CubicO group peptidase (beta-lactamase class C family)
MAVAVSVSVLSLDPGLSAQMMKVPGGYFEDAVQPFVTAQQYMGAASLTRGDIVMLSKGFGSANLQPALANGPTTRFPIGSLTKQFTATAILLLEERGRLTLSDPLSRHLPDVPAAWSGITLFHLLTHTSGLAETTTSAPGRPASTGRADMMVAARQQPLAAPPGDRFSYSNTGYVALGLVIEKLSGMTYAEFIRASIFTPLGMKDSGSVDEAGARARLATGYAAGPSGPAPFPAMEFDAFSAGALYSTAEDLRRWQGGLFGGKVLSPASLTRMTTPNKNDYALGIESRERNGRRVYEHSGGYGAYRNMMAYYPDDKVGVIVLANMGSAAADIADRLGAMAHGQMKTPASTTAARPVVAVSPEVLARYVGTYAVRTDDVIVSMEGSRLMLQTSAGKMELAAETDTRFTAVAGDARVEFIVSAEGAATGMVLRQGGMMMKGSKK